MEKKPIVYDVRSAEEFGPRGERLQRSIEPFYRMAKSAGEWVCPTSDNYKALAGSAAACLSMRAGLSENIAVPFVVTELARVPKSDRLVAARSLVALARDTPVDDLHGIVANVMINDAIPESDVYAVGAVPLERALRGQASHRDDPRYERHAAEHGVETMERIIERLQQK